MTPQQAYLKIVQAVAEAIRDLGSVPSGHLYARMSEFLSLEAYTRVIDTLVSAGLVERKNYLLTWKGEK